MKKILVTGGTGYLGSNMLVELVRQGYQPICVDNLSNSKASVLDTIEKIVGEKIPFVKADSSDTATMEKVFSEHAIDAVIHFAGYKSVYESMVDPLSYYRNNYNSALTVLELCLKYKSKFIFSSSATVYGRPQYLPLTEEHPLHAINPYGRTKVYIEETIQDIVSAHPEFKAAILRYFNPVGCGEKHLLGENIQHIPNNLMPLICRTAAGLQKELQVFGDDYDTPDGTGIRDFIHVVDLIFGHIAVLKKLEVCSKRQYIYIYNLGTGKGTSVLELIHCFEEVNGMRVPYRIALPRLGDVASCYADTTKVFTELSWKTQKTLSDMVYDSWIWQKKNFILT